MRGAIIAYLVERAKWDAGLVPRGPSQLGLKFVGEKTTAEIGDYNEIRECVTISRGTASPDSTE